MSALKIWAAVCVVVVLAGTSPGACGSTAGGGSDGAPAGQSGGGGAGGAGGTSGTGGGGAAGQPPDPCHPACYTALYAGCTSAGSCTADSETGATCWANGFKTVCVAPTTVFCTYTMNGAPCAVNALTTEFGARPAVWVYQDATGAELGTLTVNSDDSQIAACADGSSDVLPPSCWGVGAPCADGTCP